MKKPKWRKVWESTELRQFVFCFLGVVAYKCLDLVGQRLDLGALSLTYVGFAVAVAGIITWVTDNDPIPKDATPQQKQAIFRRVAKNAVLMGFFWQTVFEKLKELIEL